MKTIIYTFNSPATIFIARRLVLSGRISAVVLQKPMSIANKFRFLLRRIKSYGLLKVVDEVLFKIYYSIFLKKSDEKLRKENFGNDFFDGSVEFNGTPVYEVDSINSPKGRGVLSELRPDLVIMESREMIDGDTLKIPGIGFVGCHPGIIPEYRGVYASFWALRFNEPDKVGFSVYMADRGVDTGGIISQKASGPRFGISNFKVESERLMIEGMSSLLDAVRMAEDGRLRTYRKDGVPSRFFSHVGLTDYIKAVSARRKR